MKSNQTHATAQDEIYLAIWKEKQEETRTRWAVITFFLGISFAISGFSFQSSLTSEKAFIVRLAGLLIYGFACLLYWNFHSYTRFLRAYLLELETLEQTSLRIQSKTEKALRPAHGRKQLPTLLLLLAFGGIYAVGVLLLLIIGI